MTDYLTNSFYQQIIEFLSFSAEIVSTNLLTRMKHIKKNKSEPAFARHKSFIVKLGYLLKHVIGN